MSLAIPQIADDVNRLVVVEARPGDEAGDLVVTVPRRGIEVAVVRGTDPDGVLIPEAELLVALVESVGDGRHTVIVVLAHDDGGPDRQAAVRAAAAAAARTGARFVKHVGAGPEGDVVATPEDASLDDLHAAEPDPWGVDSRWYEQRKRSLLLAMLPRLAFRHGLEVGSSTGALAEDLAGRCDDLVVVDASAHAVRAARSRLRDLDHVRVDEVRVPTAWPDVPPTGFDLVVLSEVGYFLSPRALDEVIERIRTSLADDGVLVLCHWRHEVVGWPLDGADVHRAVASSGVRPICAEYRDRDVEMLVLARPDELPDPHLAGSRSMPRPP